MAFCPECRSEYQQGHETCAECNVALVDELPPDPEVVDLYAAADMLEAELIESMLREEGIEARLLDRQDHVFPTSSTGGGVHISVPRPELQAARALVEAAREDGAISDTGSFFDEG